MRALCSALLLLAVAGGEAMAQQSGFYLPAGINSSGQDEFRAADGTTCRTTMDGTKRLEVGTYGSGGRSDYDTSNYGLPNYVKSPTSGNAGVYGRFTMSLDAKPGRMDCNKLYELELERRRLEVEIMKRSLTAADRKLDDLRAEAPRPRPAAPAGKAKGAVRVAKNAPPP